MTKYLTFIRSQVCWCCFVLTGLGFISLLVFRWNRDFVIPYGWNEISSWQVIGRTNDFREPDPFIISIDELSEIQKLAQDHDLDLVIHSRSHSINTSSGTSFMMVDMSSSQFDPYLSLPRDEQAPLRSDTKAIWALKGSIYEEAYLNGFSTWTFYGQKIQVVNIFDDNGSSWYRTNTEATPNFIAQIGDFPMDYGSLHVNTVELEVVDTLTETLSRSSNLTNYTYQSRIAPDLTFHHLLSLISNDRFSLLILLLMMIQLTALIFILILEITSYEKILAIHRLVGGRPVRIYHYALPRLLLSALVMLMIFVSFYFLLEKLFFPEIGFITERSILSGYFTAMLIFYILTHASVFFFLLAKKTRKIWRKRVC